MAKITDQTATLVLAQFFVWQLEAWFCEKTFSSKLWAVDEDGNFLTEDAEQQVQDYREAVFGRPTHEHLYDVELPELRAYVDHIVGATSDGDMEEFMELAVVRHEVREAIRKAKPKVRAKGMQMSKAEAAKNAPKAAATKKASKKAPAKKAAPKKAAAKKTPAKKAPAKKAPKKAPAKLAAKSRKR